MTMWFFGKSSKIKQLGDKIWLTPKERYQGLYNDLQTLPNNTFTFVFCFFNETYDQVKKLLKEPTNCRFINSSDLEYADSIKQTIRNNSDRTIQFFVVEHYPIYSPEKKMLDKLETLVETKTNVTFYSDLDQPLLEVFGSNRIKDLMLKLGIKENECISHTMISKSIVSAQKKLEEKIQYEQKADSQHEWFSKNNRR